jgi:quercetin dioxygenase-like cupin family protein
VSPQVARLWDHALNSLGREASSELLRDLADDERARVDLAWLVELGGLLPLAVAPIPPPSPLRARLLTTVGVGAERFSPLLAAFRRMVDLGRDRARALLQRIDDAAAWTPGPFPGFSLVDLEGGPRVATADVGFVRLAPGLVFPRHRHLGDEETLILEGSYIETDGTRLGPGDQVVRRAGSVHGFTVDAAGPCIYAFVLQGGVEQLA